LPYADCIPTAFNEIAPERPMPVIEVEWLEQAQLQLQQLESERYEQVKAWIGQLIALDPRPAYKHNEVQASYAMQLFELDIHWQIIAKNKAQVCQVIHLDI
jgi:tRNA (adenine37-N6)-methyltransferase